jgi:HK97 family phage major capsid protein
MNISKQALLEIHDLTTEASRLAAGSASDRKQADVLLQKCAIIRSAGVSTHEMRVAYSEALGDQIHGTAAQHRARHEVLFRRYVQSKTPQHRTQLLNEYRDAAAQAGALSISYTQGATGGVLVPFSFYENVTEGMAQTDPLLDPKNVNLITEPGYAMNPKILPGYDLTQIKATRVSENSYSGVPDAFPVSSSEVLNAYPYVMATFATKEFEDDDFESSIASVARAHGVGMARAIGADLVTGSGSAQPQGLLTGASNSGITIGTPTSPFVDLITLDDILEIYFAVNRFYRNSPKCAWVMNDTTYQLIRRMQAYPLQNEGLPFINVVDDRELLMGKPVLVSPSMPSGAGSKAIVFGDLSHFNVRVSAMYFRKANQAEFAVESARDMHISRMRADSVVFDPATQASPTNTQAAPIIYATMHS